MSPGRIAHGKVGLTPARDPECPFVARPGLGSSFRSARHESPRGSP
jgi:hypothetical protein